MPVPTKAGAQAMLPTGDVNRLRFRRCYFFRSLTVVRGCAFAYAGLTYRPETALR